MFLQFSEAARSRAREVVQARGQQRGARVLAAALRIAWDRLGPRTEYIQFGHTYRRGYIEPQDIDAALRTP